VGDRDGDEVAELYLMPPKVAGAAAKTLVGFQKIFVPKHGSRTVQMKIDPRQLSLVSATGVRTICAGEYQLFVGGGQPLSSSGLHLPFRIIGSALQPR
jgi:beta-glucosidase